MSKKIDVHKKVFKTLAGNQVTVTKEWLKTNDRPLLITIVGRVLDKVPDWLSEKDIDNSGVEKVRLEFKENQVECFVIFKDGEEKKVLIDKYDQIHWEDHLIYLIEADLLG